MRGFIIRHQLAAFVVLAYAISWADWVPLALGGALVTPGGSITHFPGLLGPAIAAFIVTGVVDGWSGIAALVRRQMHVSLPSLRFLAYSLSPVAFLALAIAVIVVMGAPMPSVREFAVYSGLRPLPVGWVLVLVFLFNGYGEETGWRGFALARLQRRAGAVKGALLVGLIWAGWHVPSFWIVEGYRNLGVGGLIGAFGLGILAGSIVLARVMNRTGGSILAVSLWHATYNLTSATAASRGVVGAVTTMCVMVWAAVLLIQEWRRPLAVSRLIVPQV